MNTKNIITALFIALSSIGFSQTHTDFKNNWSVRELQRQFDSALYTRLVLSRDKDKVKELSEKGLVLEKPKDAIKDLTFLNLSDFLNIPNTLKAI